MFWCFDGCLRVLVWGGALPCVFTTLCNGPTVSRCPTFPIAATDGTLLLCVEPSYVKHQIIATCKTLFALSSHPK